MSADQLGEAGGGLPALDVRDAFCLHPLPDGGAVAALRGLSLRVASGELLVVHGPNGSGKTTLLRVLAGEQRLAAGRAVVAGLDLAGAGDRQLADWRCRRLGQLDQDPRRLLRAEFDVLDNVALQLRVAGAAAGEARARAESILADLGLADLAARRVGTLSGGQRQRVAVCAALAHRPELVLADEPTGELDVESADAVYALLAAAVRTAGASLVLVTHDQRAGAIADRVVRIRDGRISETWRPARRCAAPPAAAALSAAAPVAAPVGQHVPPVCESLVVDDRGWVRIPVELRSRLGLGAEVSAQVSDGALVLRPTPDLTPGRTAPTAPSHPARPTSDSAAQPTAAQPTAAQPTAAQPTAAQPTAAQPDAGQPDARSGRLLVEVSGLVVGYGGGRPVIGSPGLGHGLDLRVKAGELVLLAGRSGAGKSTMLRVVLGLQRPDSGEVHLNGVPLAGLDRSRLAEIRGGCSAVVTQQIYLASTLDAAANLDLARAARGLPADPEFGSQLLARLGLGALAGRQAGALSGGERQRLAVAQALAVRPALLVLDEPTSQLDEVSAGRLAEVLVLEASSGMAILAASHDPVLIGVAARVIDLP